jgi:hypothetical protein
MVLGLSRRNVSSSMGHRPLFLPGDMGITSHVLSCWMSGVASNRCVGTPLTAKGHRNEVKAASKKILLLVVVAPRAAEKEEIHQGKEPRQE